MGTGSVERGVGDGAGRGRAGTAPLEVVQLGRPGDGRHRVGQRVVGGEGGQVVPGAVVLESGAAGDVDESEHGGLQDGRGGWDRGQAVRVSTC